jgi:hypothetical protein
LGAWDNTTEAGMGFGGADEGKIWYNSQTDRLRYWNGTTNKTVGTGDGDMLGANNLGDIADAATSRNNLGLGTMAVATATDYLDKSGNLSGLANAGSARTNLGLGTSAVVDTGTTFGNVPLVGTAGLGVSSFALVNGSGQLEAIACSSGDSIQWTLGGFACFTPASTMFS